MKFLILLFCYCDILINSGNAWRLVEVQVLYFQPTCTAEKPDQRSTCRLPADCKHSWQETGLPDRTGPSTIFSNVPPASEINNLIQQLSRTVN